MNLGKRSSPSSFLFIELGRGATGWLAIEVEFFAHVPEFEPFSGLRSLESDIELQQNVHAGGDFTISVGARVAEVH